MNGRGSGGRRFSRHGSRALALGLLLIVAPALSFAETQAPPPQAASPAPGHAPVLRAVTTKAFRDVVDQLEFAISERNFRLTGRNDVGRGIRERGHPDFPDMEVLHFCSLEYAREVLELDPAFIAQMPCRVTVHQAGAEVVVQMILLPEDHADARVNAFARRMNGLLREILDYALEPDLPALGAP